MRSPSQQPWGLSVSRVPLAREPTESAARSNGRDVWYRGLIREPISHKRTPRSRFDRASKLLGQWQVPRKGPLAPVSGSSDAEQRAITGAETVIAAYPTPFGYLCCAVHEFTVRVLQGNPGHMRVRTFFSSNGSDYGTPLDTPVPACNLDVSRAVHIRGWWPHSNLYLVGPFPIEPPNSAVLPWQLVPTNVGIHRMPFQLCYASSPEEEAYRDPGIAVDPFNCARLLEGKDPRRSNNGLYGVDLVYRAALVNSASNATPFGVALVGRGTPSGFTGAAFLEPFPPSPFQPVGVPTIKRVSPSDPTSVALGQKQVPPADSTDPKYIDTFLAVGGGASLPVDMHRSSVELQLPDEEEG